MLVVSASVDDSGHEDPGHPERHDRVTAVTAGIDELGLGEDLIVAPEHRATRAELARVHSANYLDDLGAFCYEGGGDIDQDTYATYDSWSIATLAAGAGLAVVDELRRREDGVGFVVTRPPGHHALSDRAMGFCLLNNIAVTAASLVDDGERVLIVDWDVHHGNGTQSIFWDEPNVLYVSTHQWPLFPGSGVPQEVGGPRALGTTVNLPVPPGATGDVLANALETVAAPVIDEFSPTWVLVSAGFDAHRDDPMADLALTSGDFARLARLVNAYVPRRGRLAMFLEGGYDLDALRTSVAASLAQVLDAPYESEGTTRGGPGEDAVARAQRERRIALDQQRDALSNVEDSP